MWQQHWNQGPGTGFLFITKRSVICLICLDECPKLACDLSSSCQFVDGWSIPAWIPHCAGILIAVLNLTLIDSLLDNAQCLALRPGTENWVCGRHRAVEVACWNGKTCITSRGSASSVEIIVPVFPCCHGVFISVMVLSASLGLTYCVRFAFALPAIFLYPLPMPSCFDFRVAGGCFFRPFVRLTSQGRV